MKKSLCMGLLAHVDAGKTTLSEAILYETGEIRKLGRVDHGDSYLDGNEMERNRGITVFSKQANYATDSTEVTLLDTPGHVDFSAEMERVLSVIDYGILIISASEGIQSHTETLWRLLRDRDIPVIVFINKMDLAVRDRQVIIQELCDAFGEGFADFSNECAKDAAAAESNETQGDRAGGRGASAALGSFGGAGACAAISDEGLIDEVTLIASELAEKYLMGERISDSELAETIVRREIYPCIFGAALRQEGVRTLINCIDRFTTERSREDGCDGEALGDEGAGEGRAVAGAWSARSAADAASGEFGARVFKVMRDRNDERLTFMRITCGTLKSRDLIEGKSADGTTWQEKVNQIRIYSGMKFATVDEVKTGAVCAVTGLTQTLPGDAIGNALPAARPELEPFVMHSVISAIDANGASPNSSVLLKAFQQLAEEDPKLHVSWDEVSGEVTLRLMGRMQLEILQQMVLDRFGYRVEFGPAKVVYAETISKIVEGAGHFEPLRHYAEVHLILEPTERGSGITIDSIVPEDVLARNWQRLIMTHLEEKEHIGVLIGAPITDMKITLAAGRAHDKHTNGGDFREATYRALRQGLMQARANGTAVLLEPHTDFRIEVGALQLGKVMTDMEQLGAEMAIVSQGAKTTVFEGRVASSSLMDYLPEFTAATGGQGRIAMKQAGYEPCANAQEIIEASGYEPERDVRNPADSVFVSHTASDIVPWDKAMERMHIQPVLRNDSLAKTSSEIVNQSRRDAYRRAVATDAELKAIFERTFKRSGNGRRKEAEERNFNRKNTSNAAKRQSELSEAEMMANAARNEEIRSRHQRPTTQNTSNEPAMVLVDGYNLINSDSDLKELAARDIGSARDAIIDRLINYRGYMRCDLVVVFDAYKVSGGVGSEEDHWGVRVIYTEQDEPADIRIGKIASTVDRKRTLRVVSSDNLVQQNALVNNALRVSSAEFLGELDRVEAEIANILDMK